MQLPMHRAVQTVAMISGYVKAWAPTSGSISPEACRTLTLAPRPMGSSIACSRIVDQQKEGQGQRHAQFPSHRVVRVLHLPRQAITPLNEAADTTDHTLRVNIGFWLVHKTWSSTAIATQSVCICTASTALPTTDLSDRWDMDGSNIRSVHTISCM